MDYNQYFTTDTVEGALDELGAAKLSPINKTNTMTLSVGRDTSGQLWTEDKTDVFNVEYGTTLYNDIVNAYNSGKICVMQVNSKPYFLTKITDRTMYFVWNTNDTDRRVVTLNRSGNVYSEEISSPIIAKSSLVQAIDESVSTNIENPPTTKAVYDALHSLNIDSINGLRNEFGMIADAFGEMAEDINAKISCTDAQVGSYGYIKLSDLPIYDGGVV